MHSIIQMIQKAKLFKNICIFKCPSAVLSPRCKCAFGLTAPVVLSFAMLMWSHLYLNAIHAVINHLYNYLYWQNTISMSYTRVTFFHSSFFPI
uniref:Uncharacterized protein n=1 Tax=Anguilla anguilla TaxID=7936 RepID=A0A0E9WG81_ANGAN